MKAKFYDIIMESVSDGIAIGYRRAHKHDDNPSEEVIFNEIENEVGNNLHKYLDFQDEIHADN